MGQGQEVHARRLLQQGMTSGGWLLLQNCHLSLAYIEEVMDQIIETENIHDEFRLWVTTEVHKKFSINFLQVNYLCFFRIHVCCVPALPWTTLMFVFGIYNDWHMLHYYTIYCIFL